MGTDSLQPTPTVILSADHARPGFEGCREGIWGGADSGSRSGRSSGDGWGADVEAFGVCVGIRVEYLHPVIARVRHREDAPIAIKQEVWVRDVVRLQVVPV